MFYRVARSQKIKKAKFGQKQLQKRPNSQMVKRPNEGQIFVENKKNIKLILSISYIVASFDEIDPKWPQKDTFFFKIEKRPTDRIILFLETCFKKGQMATLIF